MADESPAEQVLRDQVVLVSGGTQGVGGAIARAAAGAGASVMITGRRAAVGERAAAEVSEQTGRAVGFVPADVADVASAQASVAATIERFGKIDGLVNAAGLTTRGSLLDTDVELFDAHVAINFRGPFFLMQAAVRDMIKRGEPGAIVNVITMSALGGQPYLAPYSASKAGLLGLTKNAAYAHRWDQIKINGINIGWTQTEGEDAVQREFHDADDTWLQKAAAQLPMGRLIQVDEVARLALLLLDPRSLVTGSVINWDQQVPGAHD